MAVVGATACEDPQRPIVTPLVLATADTTLDPSDTLLLRPEVRIHGDDRVAFESSDTTVAAVDYRGLVVALRRGGVVIRARLLARPEVADSLHLTVRGPVIKLESVQSTLEQFAQDTLEVRLGVPTDRRVRWTISDSSVLAVASAPPIASISAPFLAWVTALRPGTATITVRSEADTSVSASATYTVVPARVARIVVTPPAATVGGVSQTLQLSASLRSAAGSPLTDPRPSWRSDQPEVATVSSTGLVTTVGAGTATIVAEADGTRGEARVVVAPLGRDVASTFWGARVSVSVLANDWAPTGASPRLLAVDAPAHGTARVDGSVVTYEPTSGFVGVDSMRYRALSGADTASAWVVVGTKPGPFDVTPLGERGDSVTARDLNDRGQIAGHYVRADGVMRAFRWEAGQYQDLETPPELASYAMALNDAGDVAGHLSPPSTYGCSGAMLWPAGAAPERRDGGWCFPRGIDARRRVLTELGIWEGGVRTDPFNGFWPSRVRLVAFNDRGDVLAWTTDAYPNGLLLRNGAVVKPGDYPGRYSYAEDLSDSGLVVGEAENMSLEPGSWTQPFLWRPMGGDIPLTSRLGPSFGAALHVNDRGWVLGRTGSYATALWIGEAVFGFDELLARPAEWRIESPIDLNERGQVLATARDLTTGRLQPVLLTPRP